jgi:hypothetical protein
VRTRSCFVSSCLTVPCCLTHVLLCCERKALNEKHPPSFSVHTACLFRARPGPFAPPPNGGVNAVHPFASPSPCHADVGARNLSPLYFLAPLPVCCKRDMRAWHAVSFFLSPPRWCIDKEHPSSFYPPRAQLRCRAKGTLEMVRFSLPLSPLMQSRAPLLSSMPICSSRPCRVVDGAREQESHRKENSPSFLS